MMLSDDEEERVCFGEALERQAFDAVQRAKDLLKEGRRMEGCPLPIPEGTPCNDFPSLSSHPISNIQQELMIRLKSVFEDQIA